MIFGKFFGKAKRRERTRPVYAAAMAQARQPSFFTDLGVPDTLDGRFEVLMLHVFLIMRRLRKENDQAVAEFSQDLFDFMFDDVDINLRNSGVNDIRIGGKVKKMAKTLYGRIAAYDAGLDGEGDLSDALNRNLFKDVDDVLGDAVEAVTTYVKVADAILSGQTAGAIMKGEVSFPDAPAVQRDMAREKDGE